MASRIVVFGAVIVFLYVGASAIAIQDQQTLRDAGNETVIENETFSVTAGALVPFDESNRSDSVYNDSITIFQNGTEFRSGGNYTYFEDNGTIRISDPTNLNTSKQANATYRFYDPVGAQNTIRLVGTLPIQLGSSLLYLLAFAVFMVAIIAVMGVIT